MTDKLLDAIQSDGSIDSKSATRQQILDYAKQNGFSQHAVNTTLKTAVKVGRGVYDLTTTTNPSEQPTIAVTDESRKKAASMVKSQLSEDVYIPSTDKTFVRWGFYSDIKSIINSKMFFPVFISGLSGNGKTMMVEQACAAEKREYIRVQINPETDEDDLLGGFRLVDGETVFAKGPVVRAMEAGAILLIDEVDRGSNKLMSLQGVLEGKPILIKKTGETIYPAPGFNVIATANTKGQGSEDGRFISATIIDEAFLERFVATFEQPYPSVAVERKIVANHMIKYGVEDSEFTDKLVNWGQAIRDTYNDGGVEDLISTRRLCHIVQTFAVFSNRKKAVELCTARFDEDTRAAFVDLYDKIDAEAVTHDTTQSFDGQYNVDVNDDRPF